MQQCTTSELTTYDPGSSSLAPAMMNKQISMTIPPAWQLVAFKFLTCSSNQKNTETQL